MNDDFDQCFFTRDDPEIAVTITHHRDVIAFGGKVEQDYRFLNYIFAHPAGDVEATMYLDNAWKVSVTVPPFGAAIPAEVIDYLKRRFTSVLQLGGPDGYAIVWEATTTVSN